MKRHWLAYPGFGSGSLDRVETLVQRAVPGSRHNRCKTVVGSATNVI